MRSGTRGAPALASRLPFLREYGMRAHMLISSVALLLALEAHTGQVHIEDISLADVVRGSALVVVAAPADPAQRVEIVDITPKGEKPNPEKWPPYRRVFSRFVVSAVVRSRDPSSYPSGQLAPLPVGSTIEVRGANAATEENLHVRYYVEGVSKSPIYAAYAGALDGDKPLAAHEPRLLFLTPVGGTKRLFAFVADGAVERLSRRTEVETLWAKPAADAP